MLSSSGLQWSSLTEVIKEVSNEGILFYKSTSVKANLPIKLRGWVKRSLPEASPSSLFIPELALCLYLSSSSSGLLHTLSDNFLCLENNTEMGISDTENKGQVQF